MQHAAHAVSLMDCCWLHCVRGLHCADAVFLPRVLLRRFHLLSCRQGTAMHVPFGTCDGY